jgi:hypothetical protein
LGSCSVIQSSHSGALRAVMEMGVFDAIPVDGSSTTATELAQKLNVDKNLLGKLSQIVLAVEICDPGF